MSSIEEKYTVGSVLRVEKRDVSTLKQPCGVFPHIHGWAVGNMGRKKKAHKGVFPRHFFQGACKGVAKACFWGPHTPSRIRFFFFTIAPSTPYILSTHAPCLAFFRQSNSRRISTYFETFFFQPQGIFVKFWEKLKFLNWNLSICISWKIKKAISTRKTTFEFSNGSSETIRQVVVRDSC